MNSDDDGGCDDTYGLGSCYGAGGGGRRRIVNHCSLLSLLGNMVGKILWYGMVWYGMVPYGTYLHA